MRFWHLAAAWLVLASPATAQDWMVVDPGQGIVALSSGTTAASELSGLAWSENDQFYAVGDNAAQLFPLTIDIDPATGTISSAALSNPVAVTGTDLEGVTGLAAGGDVVISDESGPNLRVHNPLSGALVQSIAVPSVFANIRTNLSFEAVEWDADNQQLWTTNEEALSVDGPVSGFTAGTVIRLQQFDNTFTPSGQWAYETDPLPGNLGNPGRDVEVSGVPALIAMPGGALLVLERAVGNSALVRHRLYQVDFSAATDTSALAALDGASYTPVAKRLVWSQDYLLTNFEGAALAAPLNDGSQSLVLIADDGGGLLQALVALTLRVVVCGDTFAGGDEQCDDGNLDDNDGCDSLCQVEFCGDGIINNSGTEVCDDGNMADGDGCSSSCQLERATIKCQETVAKAGRSYFEARTKNIQSCRRSLNKGKLLFEDEAEVTPISDPNDCVLELRTTSKIIRAGQQAHKKIAKKCDDLTLGLLTACAAQVAALVDASGTSGCLPSSHAAAAGAMIDAQHGTLIPVAEVDRRKCQEVVAKAGASYARATIRALQSCRNKLNKGKVLYLDAAKTQLLEDPDSCAEEVKTAIKIGRGGEKLRKAVAKRCNDTLLGALGSACSTTLDGLVDSAGQAGCLITSHRAAVDAMIAAQY